MQEAVAEVLLGRRLGFCLDTSDETPAQIVAEVLARPDASRVGWRR